MSIHRECKDGFTSGSPSVSVRGAGGRVRDNRKPSRAYVKIIVGRSSLRNHRIGSQFMSRKIVLVRRDGVAIPVANQMIVGLQVDRPTALLDSGASTRGPLPTGSSPKEPSKTEAPGESGGAHRRAHTESVQGRGPGSKWGGEGCHLNNFTPLRHEPCYFEHCPGPGAVNRTEEERHPWGPKS